MTKSLYAATAPDVRALAGALGFGEGALAVDRAFELASASWGGRPLGGPPTWCGVTDDCSPVEYSVALGGAGPELRVLTEAQADPASPESYWRAGLGLTESLARLCGADTGAFERVAPLFAPSAPAGEVFFAIFHALVFRPGEAPLVKVYFNPAAGGAARAREACASALERLGLGGAWGRLEASGAVAGAPTFFSIDLGPPSRARVKLYTRHRECSAAAIERASAGPWGYAPGDATGLLSAMSGGQKAVGRAGLVAYYFSAGGGPLPYRTSFQMPVYPYALDDATASSRLRAYLAGRGLDARDYERALAALAGGGGRGPRGLHSWVSCQRDGERPRVTAYFNPCLYLGHYGALSLDPKNAWAPTAAGEGASGSTSR